MTSVHIATIIVARAYHQSMFTLKHIMQDLIDTILPTRNMGNPHN